MSNYYIKLRYTDSSDSILTIEADSCKVNSDSHITEFYKGTLLVAFLPTENISLMRYMVPITHNRATSGRVLMPEDCCERACVEERTD